MNDIHRVGIVGCGMMGSGIAETCARKGLDVQIAVSRTASATAGRRRIVASLDRGVRKQRISENERDAAVGAISFTTDLADLAERDLIVEAISEDETAKRQIFQTLDKVVVWPDAILASTTSSIPIMKLARATGRAGQVVGMHFFNPAPVQPLVELVESLVTDHQTGARAEHFLTEQLGKDVVRAQDRAGFVVNALLIPYLLSAIRMVESGFASAADIDKAMMMGCAHPVGPLALVDLIGLDVVAAVAERLHAEFQDPQHATPPVLSRMVDAGLLGRKSGVGFHTYAQTKS